jgi:hypothetical protein
VPDPEPEHHGRRCGELDQEGDADLHPLDGAEVGQLGADHADQTEHRHEPRVVAQQVPAAAQHDQPRDGEHQRRERDPGRDGGAGRPAGHEESLGDRAGHPEGHRREDGEGEPGPRRPARGHRRCVMSQSRHDM